MIIAEDITARFLNVISLFNGTIPLIALQMNALTVDGKVTLAFTKVLDEFRRGLEDEDEGAFEPADRAYWEARGTKETVAIADELLEILRGFDPKLDLKYNKSYIGLARHGQPDNFVIFRPKKGDLNLEPRLEQTEEIEKLVTNAGLDTLPYEKRWGRYRIRLDPSSVKRQSKVIAELMKLAYEAA